MQLLWSMEATRARDEVFDHIEADSPIAALELDALFSHRAGQLLLHPMLGRPGRVHGTRELVVHPHYLLIYDIRGDLIRILQLLHTARRWPGAE